MKKIVYRINENNNYYIITIESIYFTNHVWQNLHFPNEEMVRVGSINRVLFMERIVSQPGSGAQIDEERQSWNLFASFRWWNAAGLKGKRGMRGMFRRPHLTLLLIVFGLLWLWLVIGMFMFSKRNDQLAIQSKSSTIPLILISTDGFRYDYLKKGLTPTLMKLCKRGIHGPMKPQFPSYTFPNHFSLVTGFVPESHGIVEIPFYDLELDDYFSYTDQANLKNPSGGKPNRFGIQFRDLGCVVLQCSGPGLKVKYSGKETDLL